MRRAKPAVRSADRQTIYAGIDAGGSHTEAVVIDGARHELGRARGGPGALRPDNAAAVAATLARTIRAAGKKAGNPPVRSLVIAAAGAGRPAERGALKRALARHKVARKVTIVGDGEAALESAFPGAPGIVVISGTGSIAYARDRSGTLHRTGGLGWQLGDEGSGFSLGRAALGAAGKAAEGRGPATIILEMTYRATATKNLDALIRWAQKATRDDIAALGQVACRAAMEGDPVGRALVEGAALELTEHALALVRRLQPEPPAALALGGGLLAADSPVRARLIAALERSAPHLRVATTTIDPALGAASLAMTL